MAGFEIASGLISTAFTLPVHFPWHAIDDLHLLPPDREQRRFLIHLLDDMPRLAGPIKDLGPAKAPFLEERGSAPIVPPTNDCCEFENGLNNGWTSALLLCRVADGDYMEHANPIALIVEDDIFQRLVLVTLLEESEMDVIQCDSAETALRELEKTGECVSMLLTDVNLAGKIDGVELAHFAHQCYPDLHVIVTSGSALTKSLPDGAMFMSKPLVALDVIREAERARH